MEKIEGAPPGGAGHPCPALLKLLGIKNKNVCAMLLVAAGTCLVSGLCYGSHCWTHANHIRSEARSFNCHSKVGRRKSVTLVAEGHKNKAEIPKAETLKLDEQRPECVVRAEMCVNRLPDGKCQTTAQPCRLFVGCEPHGPSGLDDIRAMLAEIRAGVAGLAQGPPSLEKAEILKGGTLKVLPDGHLADCQRSNLRGKNTTANGILGRLRWANGFSDVWLGDEHYDLRGRAKARFCIQFLVAKQAFDADSARHLEKEIDPFVRKKCQLPPPSEIRIQHYFNDRSGKLSRLRSDLVKAAGRNGRFYLQVV